MQPNFNQLIYPLDRFSKPSLPSKQDRENKNLSLTWKHGKISDQDSVSDKLSYIIMLVDIGQMNTTLARPVLSISFVVTSLVGVAFLLAFWLSIDVVTATVRATLFVASMAAVHWIGYRLYAAQDSPTMPSRNVDFSHVRPHLSLIAATQLPCLILAAMLLDGGRGFRICVAAVFAHWLAIAFISARDRSNLTTMDTFVMRWGFFPCLVCAALIGNAIW